MNEIKQIAKIAYSQIIDSEIQEDLCREWFDKDIVEKNISFGTLPELIYTGICHKAIPIESAIEKIQIQQAMIA